MRGGQERLDILFDGDAADIELDRTGQRRNLRIARAVEADRRFVVVGPPYSVRRAFELSGFDEVITVVEDIAEV